MVWWPEVANGSMIELTEEQQREIAKGREVRAIDRATNTQYVLVRADLYERLKVLLADETVYATADLLDRVMAEDDANDPHLESYQAITREGSP